MPRSGVGPVMPPIAWPLAPLPPAAAVRNCREDVIPVRRRSVTDGERGIWGLSRGRCVDH